jgi:hypothetical protein
MRSAVIPAALAVGAIVFALAFELNYLAPSSTTSSLSAMQSTSPTSTPSSTTGGISAAQSTSTNSTSIGLTWFGAPEPAPSSCGREEAAYGGTGDGYNTTLYLPSGDDGEYLLGSTICILTNFQNSDNQSTSLPSTEIVKVLNSSSGVTVYEGGCSVPSSYAGSFGPKSAWNCAVIWDTSKPYDGILPTTGPDSSTGPDSYAVSFTISMADSYQVQMGGGGISLTTSLPSATAASSSASTTSLSSTTTTSSSTSPFSCGTGQAFTPLTALQSGPMYLKVTTDQGAIIDNGTVLVTHVDTNGRANYCIDFAGGSQPNSTGYFPITANDGLSPTGTYNITLFVYEPIPGGYVGSLPPFNVTTNTSVAVSWSVPSGAVLIVTHPQGSTEIATTTTTATSVGVVGGGVYVRPAKVTLP